MKNKSIFIICFIMLISAAISAADIDCDSGDLSTTCTLSSSQTVYNDTICNNLIISSGILTIDSHGKTGGAGQITINCTGNITISSGSSIRSNALGYDGGYFWEGVDGKGPGKGKGNEYYEGYGAGHGGLGGGDNSVDYGNSYGSIQQPTEMGSGGGGNGNAGSPIMKLGGDGGGAIKIIADILTVNGSINADGGNGGDNGGNGAIYGAGGGSGGSIWIIANQIEGSSSITANGGAGGYYGGGAGAGGRIAIHYTTNSFTGTISTNGGEGTGDVGNVHYYGGAGTIYKKSSSQSYGDLIIDNTFVPESQNIEMKETPLYEINYNFDSITLGGELEILFNSSLNNFNGGNLTLLNRTVSFGTEKDMQLKFSNVIIYEDATLTQKDTTTSESYSLFFNITNDFTLLGTIDLNSKGYDGGMDPQDGYGDGGGTTSSGAGYGGDGGGSQNGSSYGNLTEPSELGSGGGGMDSVGGSGGGAIRLIVGGNTTINGTVTANGGDGSAGSGSIGSGGGSGGSIWIYTNGLTGNGSISANGGDGGDDTNDGGSGAGGRLAVFYNSIFDNLINLSVIEGQFGILGENGTTILEHVSYILRPIYTNFKTSLGTTNFTALTDFSNVTNVSLAKNGYGKIKFPESYGLFVEKQDYDNNIIINDKSIFANSSVLDSSFNNTATLTFYNASCDAPYVYYSDTESIRDDIINENKQCLAPRCTDIQCTNDTLTVTVSSFSGYAVGGNANLTIDANDPQYENNTMQFTAEYMDVANDTLITGADCEIFFEDGNSSMMVEEAAAYTYNRTFPTIGIEGYNVTCNHSTWNTLTAYDSITIAAPPIPEFNVFTLVGGLVIVLIGLVVIRKKR